MDESLLDSFEIHLNSRMLSDHTVSGYLRGVSVYLRDEPEITRTGVQRHLAKLIADGKESNTVRIRLGALRAFTKWAAEEGEISEDPLTGLKPPRPHKKVTPALTDEELSAVIRACKGSSFRDRRDEAILRLMAETGLRSQECLDLALADVEPLKRGIAVVRKGKGAKGRTVAFGPQTAASLDRYVRARRLHKYRDLPNLWLGTRGPLKYHGLNETLRDRASDAGIAGFHLHLLRHTFAQRWLRAEGSEQALMTMAGWTSRQMLDRYTSASASERAMSEAKRLGLGDI